MGRKILNRTTSLALVTAMVVSLFSGCTFVGNAEKQGSRENVVYKVAEEANQEVMMENRPEAPYWFVEDLMTWKPENDPDLIFNQSNVPLASRVERNRLNAVNQTQKQEVNLVALSIMNASTSGNAPNGLNRFDTNAFTHWQYVDQMVYWGGSAGEGIIVPPSADVIDAAHTNGVSILGTVFFPPIVYGGKMEWLEQFLQKDGNGNFPMVDQLIAVAQTYGFDGWFINQESEGTDEMPLTQAHADDMKAFIAAFKAKAPEHMDIMWYDAMTVDGTMDWQNGLTEKNAAYMTAKGKEPVLSDSMFLNFWWTAKSLAEKELLKQSNQLANTMGIDPYQLYAGIDLQANGFMTPINWGLYYNQEGMPYTSLGLYCPSWSHFSAGNTDDFHLNESLLWVNGQGNPTKSTLPEAYEWPGVSTFVVERSPITSAPFSTHFSTGNGYNFFIDGQLVSKTDWNNRSMSSVMPTYRWMINQGPGNTLEASIDYGQAYYGGTSIKLRGKMAANDPSRIKLFTSDYAVGEKDRVTMALKSDAPVSADLILVFDDGTEQKIQATNTLETEWAVYEYSLKGLNDKKVTGFDVEFMAKEGLEANQIHLGTFNIIDDQVPTQSKVNNLEITSTLFDDESLFAGVRLEWEKDTNANHYEIYTVTDQVEKMFLGVTKNSAFFVNGLSRDGDQTNFEVVGVDQRGNLGASARVNLTWPDNSKPRAAFSASRTIVAPGEPIVFKSLSTANTETLSWTFAGADQESSTEQEPVVTYAKEGTYTVTLTAKNPKGEDSATIEELVLVSSMAQDGLPVLSYNKPCDASSFIHNGEQPAYALNGSVKSKWCAVGDAPHHITVDLEQVSVVSEVYIAHAEAGGESPLMNTERYAIEVSTDGENFTEVAHVKKNKLGITVDTFKPIEARYVRLVVIKPTQGSDSAARIYEFRVLGLGEPTDPNAKPVTIPKHAAAMPLLSYSKAVTATSFVAENEAPEFAVDASNATKWCAVGEAPHSLVVDLGEVAQVSEVMIAHAEAGGEGADLNTKHYVISTSHDGETYTVVSERKDNTESISVESFKTQQARFVKLDVISPTQGSDTAARIYDFRVGGQFMVGNYPLASSRKPASASSFVNDGEAPQFALDTKLDSKWCAVGEAPHSLVVDLEAVHEIGSVYIAHAEAGGEGADMNTKAYSIHVSTDGETYEEVVKVTDNKEKETLDVFTPVRGRYVKLVVEQPTQGSDTAARIYEFKVGANLKVDKLANVSMNKTATASSFVNDGEAPQYAFDGKVDSKWCAVGSAPHEILIDLGAVLSVGEVKISHAEAGGEGADMNTKAYTIALSSDGLTFEEVVAVEANDQAETLHNFKPQAARFVKLTVIKPTQGEDTAARIYEIAVGAR